MNAFLFKSTSGDRIVTGQLTGIGERQLYQLGKSIRKEIIHEDQNGLLPMAYDPNLV